MRARHIADKLAYLDAIKGGLLSHKDAFPRLNKKVTQFVFTLESIKFKPAVIDSFRSLLSGR